MKPTFSSWDILNDDRTKMIDLSLFQLSKRLHSQNPYESETHNEI